MAMELEFRFWDKTWPKGFTQSTKMSPVFTLVDVCRLGHKIQDALEKKLWVAMRSTGLLDKNGKKIFEGDIVRVTHIDKPFSKNFKERQFNCEVYYNTDGAPVYRWPREYGVCRVGVTLGKRCEVIGNIYDNPELITK